MTEPKTAKSKRVLPLSPPAERLLRDVQDLQATERKLAGSAWHETGYVFTTETGEPCDPTPNSPTNAPTSTAGRITPTSSAPRRWSTR